MFEISVVYNKYEGDKDHPVPMDYIGVLEDTGGSLLKFYYLKSIIMARGRYNVLIFQISAF